MTSFAPEEFTPEEFFGGAKFVRNFDTAYHDVTPIKLDSTPHYELRSTNAIIIIIINNKSEGFMKPR